VVVAALEQVGVLRVQLPALAVENHEHREAEAARIAELRHHLLVLMLLVQLTCTAT
jgi:hypothetical protein